MKQLIFIKSSTEVVALPSTALLRTEYTSDTSISLYFETTSSGKNATTVVVLSVTSGKAIEVIKRIDTKLYDSSKTVLFDGVNSLHAVANITGISSITTTAAP